MHVLLSGFEPFGGSLVNPSQRLVALLASDPPPGVDLTTLLLPVLGGVAPRRLLQAIRRSRPQAIVMLGESGLASGLTLERVALNLRDYRIADNAGRTVRERPVVSGGPAAYFSTLPLLSMQTTAKSAGVPAVLSTSAGTFLCNEVMYAALHALRDSGTPCGFIHVPRLPEQVLGERGAPSMDATLAAIGVRAALGCLCGRRRPGRRAGSAGARSDDDRDRVTPAAPTSPSRLRRRAPAR